MDSDEPKSVDLQLRATIAPWLLGVLALWTVAHSLNRWVLFTDDRSPVLRYAWWTGAKVVCWLVPTYLLLRRFGGASLRWLGLTTGKGLGLAAIWATLWIGIQAAGSALHLPLFALPPADLAPYALATSLLVAPIFEEVLFRGAMLRTMREGGYSRGVTVLACALAFALLHIPGWIFRRGLDPGIFGAFLGVWILGMLAGLLAWRVPTLWAPILLHWANNLWSSGAFAWLLERVLG